MRSTQNKRFSDNVEINAVLKNGVWREFIDNDTSCSILVEQIGLEYGLERVIIERLEFSYTTFSANGRKKQNILDRDDIFSMLSNV